MNSFEKAFKEVKTLVKNFKDNEKYYLSPSYSEIDARRDFIDKFFEALGWDVYHNTQKNPYEQEVRVEKNVAVGKAQKRADYSFCISPNYRDTKFYVEAKKPAKNLYNPDYYFQAIRYGWNANTPIVILTDFEEFHIIDSRFKPDIRTALDRQIERYHYSEYKDKEKLSRIYYLLSREAVEDNSIEKRAAELPKPRGKAVKKGLIKSGYQSIDESFLKELDDIRITLAKIFKKNNQGLTSEELTEATQRTIDRLVFIRFLEDKLIEGEHYVSEFGGKNSVWKDFITTSKRFDVKYNGIVFKNHPIIDSPTFKEADDVYFGKICEDISYENTPYDFNAIPIHILGSIYERFLGKIIHATNKQVRIEEKPEVRKAGGVYYTPQYIVKYIVDNTVGKLVGNKTPAEISKLRFADIACGSGSFLITVYDTLLHYIGKWYQEHPEQAKKNGCIYKDGHWVLSLKQKQEILLNNIYGVDIDYQAVEVTQLSLFLKLLEDETTANDMQVLFKEKILPDLSKNIVCGNSLIGTDIYDGNMFPSDEQRKINAMNFEDVFPDIMKNGGFDAVVGNPPYLGFQEGTPMAKKYFSDNYQSSKGKYDHYILFTEKALNLLKDSGMFGYIIPNKFMQSNYGSEIKNVILKKSIIEIIDFKDKQVFKGATNYPCIIIIKNENNNNEFNYKTVKEIIEPNIIFDSLMISQKELSTDSWILVNKSEEILLNKISKKGIPLENISEAITQGLRTGSLKVFHTNLNKVLIDNQKLERELIFPVFTGKNIKRYETTLDETSDLLLFPYKKDFSTPVEIKHFPKANNYLEKYKSELRERKDSGKVFKNTTKLWFEYWDSKPICFQKPKIIFPDISNRNNFYLDLKGIGYLNTCYAIFLKKEFENMFILGILNSRLIEFFIKRICPSVRGGYFRYKTGYIKQIPIPKITPIEKKQHDKIVQLVDQMLEAKKQLQTAKTDNDKTYYERRCETLDRQIDQLVYELYGLTEEEIKIVEGEG